MPGIRPRSTVWPHRGQVPSGVTVGGVRNLLHDTHHGTAAIAAGRGRPGRIPRSAARPGVERHRVSEIANIDQAASWDGPEGSHWSTHADHYDTSLREHL